MVIGGAAAGLASSTQRTPSTPTFTVSDVACSVQIGPGANIIRLEDSWGQWLGTYYDSAGGAPDGKIDYGFRGRGEVIPVLPTPEKDRFLQRIQRAYAEAFPYLPKAATTD